MKAFFFTFKALTNTDEKSAFHRTSCRADARDSVR